MRTRLQKSTLIESPFKGTLTPEQLTDKKRKIQEVRQSYKDGGEPDNLSALSNVVPFPSSAYTDSSSN